MEKNFWVKEIFPPEEKQTKKKKQNLWTFLVYKTKRCEIRWVIQKTQWVHNLSMTDIEDCYKF